MSTAFAGFGISTRGKIRSVRNNDAALTAKIAIRKNVIAALGGPAEVRVFDAFAGTGQLYQAAWKDCAAYTGCDLEWWRDSRLMFAADNRRVMRAIELKPFNVFDFDSYASPWEQCLILAARRKVEAGEKIGVVITEGGGIANNANTIADAARILTGIRGSPVGMARQRGAILTMAITGLAKRLRCRVASRWQADGRTGTRMAYIGLVLVGEGP